MPVDVIRISQKISELGGRRDEDLWRLHFESLSPPDQVFLAIWELRSEIYNGGFWQYFINFSGFRVPFISKALAAVGAEQVLAVVEAAIEALGKDIPWADETKRHRIIVGLAKPIRQRLYDLDRQFNKQIDELDALLYFYLSKHRGEIDVPEDFWQEATLQ